jgi:hypothetical protein
VDLPFPSKGLAPSSRAASLIVLLLLDGADSSINGFADILSRPEHRDDLCNTEAHDHCTSQNRRTQTECLEVRLGSTARARRSSPDAHRSHHPDSDCELAPRISPEPLAVQARPASLQSWLCTPPIALQAMIIGPPSGARGPSVRVIGPGIRCHPSAMQPPGKGARTLTA